MAENNSYEEMFIEIKKMNEHIAELEQKVDNLKKSQKDMGLSETVLLELLKEKNLKQSEVDELLAKLHTRNLDLIEKDKETINYKKMYEDYKEAAEDRWERLQVYENNFLVKKMCGLFLRLKKKSEDSSKEEVPPKYMKLYSSDEKMRFAKCKEKLQTLKYRPLISLVIPLYNTEPVLLEELISSIENQIYDNWEICFANGSYNNEILNEMLAAYAGKDSRIKYIVLDKNGGISYNTNQAFQLAEGEFIGMVDHDDLLTPDALGQVALALNENPELDFIYSDQDKVDECTEYRFAALHKPGWSPEMLFSGNYITHFSVIRSSLIRKVGLWDPDVDGAQDWDLFLKVAEQTNNIYSIPMVLYHWRTASTSTALSMDTKNYALNAQIRSLNNHLKRKKYNAEAYFSNRNQLEIKVRWNEPLKISVIVVDEEINGGLNDFVKFIHLELKDEIHEVIVLSKKQKRLDLIREDCRKELIEYYSYADAFNAGAKMAENETFIFTTDRAVPVDIYTYHELASWTMHPEIGIVGPKILYGNRKVNSIGIMLNREYPKSLFHKYDNIPWQPTEFGNVNWYRDVNAVDYYCFAIEKRKFNEMGELNEDYGELSMIEYCLRVQRKYRNMVNPFSIVQYNVNYPKSIALSYYDQYLELMEKYEKPDMDVYYNPEFCKIENIRKR